MPKNPVKLKSGKNNDGKKTQLQFGIPLILLAACLMPFVYGMSSWLYLLVALVLSLVFLLFMHSSSGVNIQTSKRDKRLSFLLFI
jgi:heme O synthase-like polyprenyltransferase